MRTINRFSLVLGSLCLLLLSAGCAPTIITIRDFPTTPDACRALRGGQVDAVYGDFAAMAYEARESAGTLESVRRQFQTSPYGIAINQAAISLHDAVAAALAASMGEGDAYGRSINAWGLGGGRVDPPETDGEIPDASSVPQLEDGTLRVGMEIGFAPMGFRDEADQLGGVDVELAREIGRLLGVEVEIVNMEFDELFTQLSGGQIDIAMSAITITEERRQRFLFVPYLNWGSAILVQRGNPQGIQFPAQLCGRTVGVQQGTAQIEQLQAITCY